MSNNYHISKKVDKSFTKTVESVVAALKTEGFGVLTEVDVKATLRKKLDVDFHDYVILGACNPGFAYAALQAEDRLGVYLPCNVIVQQRENGCEVSAMNPMVAMAGVENEALAEVARGVSGALERVIESL
jgi:uncharacterized protein (DUF302 family)